jgi:hypothetical protein
MTRRKERQPVAGGDGQTRLQSVRAVKRVCACAASPWQEIGLPPALEKSAMEKVKGPLDLWKGAFEVGCLLAAGCGRGWWLVEQACHTKSAGHAPSALASLLASQACSWARAALLGTAALLLSLVSPLCGWLHLISFVGPSLPPELCSHIKSLLAIRATSAKTGNRRIYQRGPQRSLSWTRKASLRRRLSTARSTTKT